ncbi:UDP-N-acetylmuramoyl-tripeptide--D-alanyl-D-alanine ligase [Paenibacillus beijingensis]|uniref:UDP-N-acetylmuramoyl-tripeptide--D-alanyl-D-alanine ligase n=1 Tax=Paenibacillus beijingensis TaxID=1126833 RepID=A0A0D5NMH8_9BACL|nr:UDP-N-acetylmuramoyl-tripeptide--D-alanyl-D-alanine ligase [Paenibacillus beijingensis]AJY76365.1 UDP-N-acetylmuramoyl-tripeptide--D-alanyl-D-alanine ligase [Paenibacillus beijingensis]
MINRKLKAIARMCGGRILPEREMEEEGPQIKGVTTDSRSVEAGQLFVPLSGDNFDGHDYVESAFAKGAAASLWQEDRPVPPSLTGHALIAVEDTLGALQRLASAYRDELGVKVIGITGSNGKTTTKDMVAAALGAELKVHKTAGNLNNHIGLPLTVLRMEESAQAAVLEMGMSGFGEIMLLSRIAKPDVGIITNIGDAHLLQLGSRANIAKAKLEITAGLKPGGLLLYNGDEPLLAEQLKTAPLPEGVRLQTFGGGESCDWRAADTELRLDSSSFVVERSARMEMEANASIPLGGTAAVEVKTPVDGNQEQQRVTIPVPGRHNINNALAAIAAAFAFGVPAAAAARGMAVMQLTGMRIQPVKAFNGATVLNDAYNANPTAVRAAIDLVEQLGGFRRKWVVLGDMLELGPQEAELHREIGAYVTPAKADAVLACGELGRHIAAGAEQSLGESGEVRHFADKDALAQWLRGLLDPADLVLVKGSRGMRMEQIVHALEQ